jgi:hypothetical protein
MTLKGVAYNEQSYIGTYMSEDKKGISWGGLVKGIVATAAIVAGAELVFPGLIAGVISAVKDVGAAIADKFAAIGTAAAAETTAAATTEAAPGALSKNIGWLATKVGGIVLAVSGLKYLTSEKEEAPERESFAAQEDMKRMQALMVARMRAQGYQPAMAMAGQQR